MFDGGGRGGATGDHGEPVRVRRDRCVPGADGHPLKRGLRPPPVEPRVAGAICGGHERGRGAETRIDTGPMADRPGLATLRPTWGRVILPREGSMPLKPPRRLVLPVQRIVQPDDTTCGPTCLAQVMRAFGADVDVPSLAASLCRNPDGGTLAVHLGQLALDRGWRARLYPFGMRVFDPTWWEVDLDRIAALLGARAHALPAGSARDEVLAWQRFVASGGRLGFHEPSPELFVDILATGRPVICGLNATRLYREPRTIPETNASDPVHGWPAGHFVTVVGYTGGGRHLHVVDPSPDAPFDAGGARHGDRRLGRYPLPSDRLIHAILLGDVTRDAVLLEVWPPPGALLGAPPERP